MPAIKYRKLPVTIEAMEYKWGSGLSICDWADNTYAVMEGYEHAMRYPNEFDAGGNGHVRDNAPAFLVIKTLEGNHRADIGDFIIKGVQGEFYPCKPDIFAATYEPAEDDRG